MSNRSNRSLDRRRKSYMQPYRRGGSKMSKQIKRTDEEIMNEAIKAISESNTQSLEEEARIRLDERLGFIYWLCGRRRKLHNAQEIGDIARAWRNGCCMRINGQLDIIEHRSFWVFLGLWDNMRISGGIWHNLAPYFYSKFKHNLNL